MRDLKQYPITEIEISECLNNIAREKEEEDKIGDMTPILLACAETRVRRFAVAILHGSDAHKEWLLEAAERFMRDEPMPEPRS